MIFFLAALALTTTVFPVPELDNCRDTKECALYCEVPANKATCWAYQTYSVTTPAVLGETTDADEKEIPPTSTALLFPILELDNCSSVRECKAFCDISTNKTACTTFRQKQNVIKAGSNVGQQTALLAHAKEELGCTSLQQCRAHCDDPVNSEQCQALATTFAPSTFRLAREALLEKARLAFQCTTLAECRAHCANPANKAACMAFAKEQTPALFRAKMHLSPTTLTSSPAPLPCTTLADCQTYCQNPEHATACATQRDGNGVKINVQQEKMFTCNTKEECERYCQANPDRCPSYTHSKDYERVKLQQQLRTKVNPGATADLEKYRRSLIEKPTTSPLPPTERPSSTPTN